ncbi:MAG TPA: JAB domain-containing protein [Herpetosiphonaceae bacterium]
MPKATTTTPTLREALAPYLSLPKLRRLAAQQGTPLREALLTDQPPADVLALITALGALLRPTGREQISAPADVAALLLVELGHLPQEQLRVVCLNTKNRVQAITTVYQGTINSSVIRVAEVFAEALRRHSAAIIVAHNHPSGDPEPSPEDIAVTRQLVEAGELLDVDVLDHLVIGKGRWVSMRERRLGFTC